jgi:hypothetical protein
MRQGKGFHRKPRKTVDPVASLTPEFKDISEPTDAPFSPGA